MEKVERAVIWGDVNSGLGIENVNVQITLPPPLIHTRQLFAIPQASSLPTCVLPTHQVYLCGKCSILIHIIEVGILEVATYDSWVPLSLL